MGPMKLYFDVRDIFRAPRLALSGKKIWIMLIANIIGYVFYWILATLSLMAVNLSFNEVISKYGLYPCIVGHGGNWFAYLLWFTGLLGWLIMLFLGYTAVARVTYKQLKGDEFYSSGDSWKYVKKHWHAVVFTHLSIAIIALFFVILAIIFALIGKIPYLGELFIGIPYLLWFSGSLFVVYTIIVLIVSFFFTHAIVATLEEDTMGSVFQNFSITWSQPWRIILYLPLTFLLAYAGLLIFGYFMIFAFSIFNQVFGHDLLMGSKITGMIGWASQIIFGPLFPPCCNSLFNGTAFGILSIPAVPESLTLTEYIGGFFIAISLFIIGFIVISYALSIEAVAETLMILIFKKKSDDDNLLERKDEEELEDEEDEDTEWAEDLPSDDNAESTNDNKDDSSDKGDSRES